MQFICSFTLILLSILSILGRVAIAEDSVPFRAIVLVGNASDQTSSEIEAAIAIGLETLKEANAFSSLSDLYVYSIYDFQVKEDAVSLKTLNISPTRLPMLLLVEIRDQKPVKVLWERPVTSVRQDLNGLLAELRIQSIPENFAVTQLEAHTVAARSLASEQERRKTSMLREQYVKEQAIEKSRWRAEIAKRYKPLKGRGPGPWIEI